MPKVLACERGTPGTTIIKKPRKRVGTKTSFIRSNKKIKE